MGGFKETFTKESDEQDEVLGYDDAAAYYFFSCLVIAVALPWTISVIRAALFPYVPEDAPVQKTRDGSKVKNCTTSDMVDKGVRARTSTKRFTTSWAIQVAVLAVIWTLLFFGLSALSQHKEIRRFDPFDILEITSAADASEIKKAYRRLALKHHKDHNPNDPMAESKFMEIKKAYDALTDDTARRNYEKYGNPDGPQASKVGIGLPKFLLEKDNQLVILTVFFFILLFMVPMTFICYYQRTKNYAANGVMIETLQFLGFYINETCRVKNCPELLAASAESRSMPMRPTDNDAMKAIAAEVVRHKEPQFQKQPLIMKNSFLISAHMQRLHHLMTPELRADTNQLLKYSLKVTQAMTEIACMREWFFTAQAMIDFRRSLVQGLDVRGDQLLQVPHFDAETVKLCKRGKNPCSTLQDFISKDAEQRKALTKIEDEQKLLDIEAFVGHVSNMDMKVKVQTEDEAELVAGDIATVIVQLHRKNLREDEAVGSASAPLFPELKNEEWWVFLNEGNPPTRIIAYERLRDSERIIEARLRFQISRPGKHRMDVHALCDSYAGIDQKVELNFMVHHPDEVKREIIVHKEDEDLDLQPTLFQQLMGDMGPEDEESEEEDDDEDKEKKKSDNMEKMDLGPDRKAKADTDEESSKKSGNDDASSASSDSDSD